MKMVRAIGFSRPADQIVTDHGTLAVMDYGCRKMSRPRLYDMAIHFPKSGNVDVIYRSHYVT